MEINSVVRALGALAQQSRLRIFRQLVQTGPSGMAAGEIAADLDIAPATLSFHLKEMNHAGLIVARQDGRFIYYSADFSRMSALVDYLTENCCARDGVTCGPTGCRPAKQARVRKKSLRKGVKT